MKVLLPFFYLFLFISYLAQAESGHSHAHSEVVFDFYAPVDFEYSADNKFDLRSAEFLLKSPVDSIFNAQLSLFAHNEDNEMVIEVHEAFLKADNLFSASRIKLGKFLLGIGQLSQTHQHDWYFSSAPQVQREFFGSDIADTGLEYTAILPESGWEIKIGATNGYIFSHSHDEHPEEPENVHGKPTVPTHYIHPIYYVSLPDASLEWGLNYLGRTDSENVQTQLFGLDFIYKTDDSEKYLIQSEIWYRKRDAPELTDQKDWGAYIYSQLSLNDNWRAGLRLDVFTDQSDSNYVIMPTVNYVASESVKLRLAYSYNLMKVENKSDEINQMLELQLLATFAADPKH